MSFRGDYKPIEDYGAIGNLRSVALVGRDGSIDWCCFPHMDQRSVFASILDKDKGGFFRIATLGAGYGEQEYLGNTNVLCTRFATDSRGSLTVTDFMPLTGKLEKCGESRGLAEIHRLVESEGEEQEVQVEWAPRFDYARTSGEISRAGNGWLATGGEDRLCLCGVEEGEIEDGGEGPVLHARFRLPAGEKRAIVTRWDSTDTAYPPANSEARLRETVQAWEDWANGDGFGAACSEWAGDWLPMVVRSALVFKLLMHADTGAIAAAPTTSLPETIRGVRNWDYRFTWIRDAFLTAQSLIALGHPTEALDLMYWMERVSAQHLDEGLELQIVYGLHGETDLKERTLDHVEGYRASRPVRVGNEAAEQFQLEVYGELMNTGLELARLGELEPKLRDFLTYVADHVCEVWMKPDYGIWEIRGDSRHMTYSKVMAWVALDRAIVLADRHKLDGDVKKWARVRQEVFDDILANGFDPEKGSFTFAYDLPKLDAANLRISLLGFLPPDDPRVVSTIDRTMEELMKNGLVYRYVMNDGLPGEEGAFGLCTFWLVDALALTGRVHEARNVFERMLGHANHLGLFSEQFDPETGEFLGNFPQAFTHIGLINSVLYLAWAEGREIPEGTGPVNAARHGPANRDQV